jgi:hypothetical protein
MVIICEKVGSTKSIRVGTVYEVLSETDTRYRIINENGVEANYCKTLFGEVFADSRRERRNEQRRRLANARQELEAAMPVAPVAPVIPVIAEINVETSAIVKEVENDDDEEHASITLKVNFIINNAINLVLVSNSVLSVYRSNIGCGIREVSGINTLMSFTTSLKPKLVEFIRVKSEANLFTLVEGFDIDELIKDIYESLLQDIISKFQGEDIESIMKAGLINFSTNINNNGHKDELLLEIFDDKADSTVEFVNPNGGNICKMWSFKTAE